MQAGGKHGEQSNCAKKLYHVSDNTSGEVEETLMEYEFQQDVEFPFSFTSLSSSDIFVETNQVL